MHSISLSVTELLNIFKKFILFLQNSLAPSPKHRFHLPFLRTILSTVLANDKNRAPTQAGTFHPDPPEHASQPAKIMMIPKKTRIRNSDATGNGTRLRRTRTSDSKANALDTNPNRIYSLPAAVRSDQSYSRRPLKSLECIRLSFFLLYLHPL